MGGAIRSQIVAMSYVRTESAPLHPRGTHMPLYQKEPYGAKIEYPRTIQLKEAIQGMQRKTKAEISKLYKGKTDKLLHLNRWSVNGAFYVLQPLNGDLPDTYLTNPSVSMHDRIIPGLRLRGFIRVVNGTPVRSGPHKGKYQVFFLRVPLLASHGTVESALSWTYGAFQVIPRNGHPIHRT